MKIGVFGDSFAALKFEKNTTLSWVDILSKKYDITNFSLTGSSLFYSVQKFKSFHQDYDKIIFLVTSPGRLLLEYQPYFKRPEDVNITSLSTTEYCYNNLINHPTTHENDMMLKIYKAALDYFKYIKNDEYDRYIHNLMVTDIVNTRSDAILIPVTRDSLKLYKNVMDEIKIMEMKEWGLSPFSTFADFRNCHMTEENNAIFATKVEKWLNGSPVEIRLDDFVTPMNKEFYIKDYE